MASHGGFATATWPAASLTPPLPQPHGTPPRYTPYPNPPLQVFLSPRSVTILSLTPSLQEKKSSYAGDQNVSPFCCTGGTTHANRNKAVLKIEDVILVDGRVRTYASGRVKRGRAGWGGDGLRGRGQFTRREGYKGKREQFIQGRSYTRV